MMMRMNQVQGKQAKKKLRYLLDKNKQDVSMLLEDLTIPPKVVNDEMKVELDKNEDTTGAKDAAEFL